MTRQQEITRFLQLLRGISTCDSDFSADTVYSLLCGYDITVTPNENGPTSLKNDYSIVRGYRLYFEYLKGRFKDTNIEVFEHEDQDKFLQFHNIEEYNHDFIKLYINVNPNFFYNAVLLIHEFMNNENIKQLSKIADHARSDAIVLRVTNIEDAVKVINFVNSNPLIVNESRKTNPFIPRCGVVGIAYDGCISYNAMVSELVYGYMNWEKYNENTPDSYAKFLEFCLLYCDKYKHAQGIEEIRNEEFFKKSFKNSEKSIKYIYNNRIDPELYLLNNYREVAELITKSTTLDDKNINETLGTIYNSFENGRVMLQSNINSIKNVMYEEHKKLIDGYINYCLFKWPYCSKYRNNFINTETLIKSIAMSFYVFDNQKEPTVIHRDNNYRAQFIDLFIYKNIHISKVIGEDYYGYIEKKYINETKINLSKGYYEYSDNVFGETEELYKQNNSR